MSLLFYFAEAILISMFFPLDAYIPKIHYNSLQQIVYERMEDPKNELGKEGMKGGKMGGGTIDN